ncbi:MAG TPA: 2TM domain-containing protein [Lacisediminihabitans sp.]|jgi:hypothetical protein|nr:2TM domain-containing protein [Lacisediminihabitans sp.]HXD60459.1 2TM domain-containing protein [Lacisediminihabitans sp.]
MDDDVDLRGRAISSLKAKSHFWFMLAVWVILSAFFVVIWWSGGGPFWPVWPIVAIGIAVAFTFVRGYVSAGGAPTEERIQREIRRLS